MFATKALASNSLSKTAAFSRLPDQAEFLKLGSLTLVSEEPGIRNSPFNRGSPGQRVGNNADSSPARGFSLHRERSRPPREETDTEPCFPWTPSTHMCTAEGNGQMQREPEAGELRPLVRGHAATS